MNILFLEQDRSTRRLVKDMLEHAGAKLIEAGPGYDSNLAAQTPAIAIIEVGGDAISLSTIARFHTQDISRPALIAIAANAAQAEPSRLAGADEVLVEPVAITALFDAIARYLPEA